MNEDEGATLLTDIIPCGLMYKFLPNTLYAHKVDTKRRSWTERERERERERADQMKGFDV